MADLKSLKGVSEQDRKMIADAEALLGPEPSTMGFVKNLFWGRVREDLIFPYPVVNEDEQKVCDDLLERLDDYMRNEHPAQLIDAEQEIPDWALRRLFEIGVLGMTIPREFGGLGLGITSYNRVLEMIGRYCGSTAVMVSAHQSIGCKAIMLFGTEEQKAKWLPRLAKDSLSAFCLSEPNVGCDAGGQETRCEWNEAEQCYVLNGEKKWATSGAISGLFTVMSKQKMADGKDKVTALVCTPEMPGIDIYQKNRSKCGIRGTWQARIRFRDVKVPKFNLLHKEGKGLNVALSCLNYGRCTLSAGMLGGAQRAFEQGTKWAQTRYQFGRPLADFELVQQKIARMSALCYAMDAMLYMTTGFLDRHHEDIMVETAICKVFCSEMGWRVVNDCVQIMGGEGYMTENQMERIFRDSRINLIVEGANEVMQSFIFAYGGKQLAEQMLGIQQAIGWENDGQSLRNFTRAMKAIARPKLMKAATPLAKELFFGMKKRPIDIRNVDPSLGGPARRLARLVRDHSYQFKLASRHYGEKIVSRQAVQARLADSAMWLHAWACVISKMDHDIRKHVARKDPVRFERDRSAAMHFFDLAELAVYQCWRELNGENPDETMLSAASAQLGFADKKLPNSDYAISENSPNAKGTGRKANQDGIKQFPGDSNPHAAPTYGANGNGKSRGGGAGVSRATKPVSAGDKRATSEV